MTNSEFAQWVLEAEQLRDEMLELYELDNRVDLQEYRKMLNENRPCTENWAVLLI